MDTSRYFPIRYVRFSIESNEHPLYRRRRRFGLYPTSTVTIRMFAYRYFNANDRNITCKYEMQQVSFYAFIISLV
jgi:hypothetical protein